MAPNNDRSQGNGENYYVQVSQSIKDIFELATRIDERVQALSRTADDLDARITEHSNNVNSLITRVTVLETNVGQNYAKDMREINENLHSIDLKLQQLSSETEKQGGRWKMVFGFAAQVAIAILTGYLLWRFGIQK